MATTTRAVLTQRLSEAIGDFEELTTTSAGNAGGTTLIDTELANLTESDDGVQGWTEATSGDNDGEIRRILGSGGYTASSTTLAFNFAHSNQVASGVTYVLHRINPIDKHNAINRAIEALSPRVLYVPLLDESLVVDNILTNPGFETGDLTGWTGAGPGAPVVETTRVFHGTTSMKIGSESTGTQTPTVNIAELLDKNVTFFMWVWSDEALTARLRIDWDGGTTFTNSDYHTGADEWQRLEINAKPPATATQVSVICDVPAAFAAQSNEGFFDAPGGLFIDRLARYTLPSTFVKGVNRVKELSVESAAQDGNYYEIHPQGRPTRGRILQVHGAGILTRPSTDTATTEVGDAHVNLIVYKAAEMLYRILAGRATGDDKADYEAEYRTWGGLARDEEALPGVRMRPMSAEINEAWHVEADGSGSYLVFDNV